MTDFLVKRFIKNSTDVNDPAVRTAYGNLAGAVGIFCNVLLCAAKLAVGTLFGSISITADAVNNHYRYKLTLKCRNDNAFRALMGEALAAYNAAGWPGKVSVYLDFHSDADI